MKQTRGCLQFAKLRQKLLIFEPLSTVYILVNEQRSRKNQRVMASTVELNCKQPLMAPKQLRFFPLIIGRLFCNFSQSKPLNSSQSLCYNA